MLKGAVEPGDTVVVDAGEPRLTLSVKKGAASQAPADELAEAPAKSAEPATTDTSATKESQQPAASGAAQEN